MPYLLLKATYMELQPKSQFISACRLLLRPVVRMLLKAGITWREFADVSKLVYVDVATREFGIRGRPTNMARVALMTGIHRAEVSRLRHEHEQSAVPVPTYLSAAQRVLSAWHQASDYVDQAGNPRPIPIEGEAPSFTELCAQYGGDMPATALQRELRRVGAIGEMPYGYLTPLMRTYIQATMDPEKVLRAGSVLEDLGNTVAFDLAPPTHARLRFERRAENDRIDPRDVPDFQAFLEKAGMAFLEQVDAWLSAHEVPESTAKDRPLIRLGAGLFHIEDLPRRGAKP